jgi:hypothetical protein
MRVCFTPLCFNAPYQFMPLPNLHPFIFALMLFVWFYFNLSKSFFLMGISFFMYTFYLRPLFLEHN